MLPGIGRTRRLSCRFANLTPRGLHFPCAPETPPIHVLRGERCNRCRRHPGAMRRPDDPSSCRRSSARGHARASLARAPERPPPAGTSRRPDCADDRRTARALSETPSLAFGEKAGRIDHGAHRGRAPGPDGAPQRTRRRGPASREYSRCPRARRTRSGKAGTRAWSRNDREDPAIPAARATARSTGTPSSFGMEKARAPGPDRGPERKRWPVLRVSSPPC